MLLANRNNLFDEMFQDPFFTRPFDSTSAQIMNTDIHEKDGSYTIEMDLPGYAKEDISAELKNGYLSISAEKNSTKEEKDDKGNCIRSERYTGSCHRSFYVGEHISQDDIKAAFTDGVLTLTVPKETPAQIEAQTKISID